MQIALFEQQLINPNRKIVYEKNIFIFKRLNILHAKNMSDCLGNSIKIKIEC